jgi:hypothetical protein
MTEKRSKAFSELHDMGLPMPQDAEDMTYGELSSWLIDGCPPDDPGYPLILRIADDIWSG